MKKIIVLLSALLPAFPAFANPAPVEVAGIEQALFTAVPEKSELPGRIDFAWKSIERLLQVPEGPAPIVYLYAFNPVTQAPRLSEIQERIRLSENPPRSPEESQAVYRGVLGTTYGIEFFLPEEADRGRVIQIDPQVLFTNEGPLAKGSGLYVTSHEMMHYAFNRLGIDPKFHHCLMVAERAGAEPLMLEVLNQQIAQGWTSEFLKRPIRSINGYALDQTHCAAETAHWEKKDGAGSFVGEVKRLAASLPK